MHRLWPLLLLAACPSPSTGDSADSAPTPDPVRLVSVGWECEDEYWAYQVGTDGWASAVELQIFAVSEWGGGPNTGVYREDHALAEVAFAEDGSWTRWELMLLPATREDQVDDVSTGLVCEVDGPQTVAFRVELFTEEGRVDCGIWGQHSADYFNTALADECYCFDRDQGCAEW